MRTNIDISKRSIMLRLLHFFMIVFIFSACSPSRYIDTKGRLAIDEKHPAIEVFSKYEFDISKDRIISLSSGVTEKEKNHKIESFHHMAVYRKNVGVDEARLIAVKAVRKLLKHINVNTDLRPYLMAHPVSHSRLNISLLMTDEKGTYVQGAKSIAKVNILDGVLNFYAYKLVKKQKKVRRDYGEEKIKTPDMMLIHQELYKDAKRIIEEYEANAAKVTSGAA
jgi:hypothetical protein